MPQIPLGFLLLKTRGLERVELRHALRDGARGADDFDFQQAGFERAGGVREGLEQVCSLLELFGGLFEAPAGDVDAAVAVGDVAGDVALVVEFEAPFAFAVFGRGGVFFFEGGVVGFGAGAQVLLGVREEVVGAAAAEVGAADFGVGESQGRGFGRVGVGGEELVAHELFEEAALFGGHGCGGVVRRVSWFAT